MRLASKEATNLGLVIAVFWQVLYVSNQMAQGRTHLKTHHPHTPDFDLLMYGGGPITVLAGYSRQLSLISPAQPSRCLYLFRLYYSLSSFTVTHTRRFTLNMLASMSIESGFVHPKNNSFSAAACGGGVGWRGTT